jgi:hypothetical protein
MGITVEDIKRMQKVLDEQAVPKPYYLCIYGSLRPICVEDRWLLWLFMNELNATGGK